VHGADESKAVIEVARRHSALPTQILLAWLLHRSPAMLPIPGTHSLAHLKENVAAAGIELSPDDVALLERRV
jgi:aryl-alcohol dehydrogenase-like predicted oxidoreductase